MRQIPRVPGSKLNSIPPGTRLRLREGLYRQLREREWIFNRTEENVIFLVHPSGAYGVVVRGDAIDWDETCQSTKN
jgi:hypothetical protein